MSPMRMGHMRAVRVLSIVAMATAFAVFLGVVFLAKGFPKTQVDLHDTGVWVSNDADGFYGRLNKAALGLDATPGPPGNRVANYELDILQDGHLVAGWDKTNAKLTPINASTVANDIDAGVSVSVGSKVDMRGGTIAVLDKTGKLWAQRYSSADTVLSLRGIDQSQPPLGDLELGDNAQPAASGLAVGIDGTVYAAGNGKFVKVAADGSALRKPEVSKLDKKWEVTQVSAVGNKGIAFNPKTRLLWFDNGKTFTFDSGDELRIQQAGALAGSVLVASNRKLFAVSLEGDGMRDLGGEGDGVPSAPVRLGNCSYVAWAGKGNYLQSCEGAKPSADKVDRTGGLVRPVFRVNRNLLALNDMANGRIFDFETKTSVDNWNDVRPRTLKDQDSKTRQEDQADAKPKAVDDELKARSDRSTVLHVLDNDTDSAGGILSIKSVKKQNLPSGAVVDISPDAQTIRLFLPDKVPAVSFRYSVTNGRVDSEAEVRVTNAGRSNSAPELRKGSLPAQYSTSSFGNLSIPVVGEWRDPEGDPVAVIGATTAEGLPVPVTADGRIEFTAGMEAANITKAINYQVTDGVAGSKPVQGSVNVNVLSARASAAVAAVAMPDAVAGEVGKPIVISPLANDIPGADPRNPQARLALGAEVASKPDLTVVTDLKSGVLTVTGVKQGTFFLEYQAGFGSAAFAKGKIMITVMAAGNTAPVAMPDQAAIHGQSAVMVDVLANDSDPGGQLLTVQGVTAADPKQIQAVVIGGRWLRILPLVDQLNPSPQVVRYTISAGGQEAVGDVTVTQLPAVAEDKPLVRDDFATTRDNDSVLISPLANDTSLSGLPLSLVTNVAGMKSAGQLKVIDPAKKADDDQGDVGTAFIHGTQIRYAAPQKVEAEKQVQIEYLAQTAVGNTAVGHVMVRIRPQPAKPEDNQAPAPQNIEMRVVSGNRVTIPIPTSGQDPDGDTTTVRGITSAPTLGRLVGVNPDGLVYEAYPSAGVVGTDRFSFEVVDRYGKSGQASIAIAVNAPGQTQPPIALDDEITARPNTKVQVNLLANDLFSRDDAVTVAPLKALNAELAPGIELASERGPLVAQTPGNNAQPVTVMYALAGNGGTGPSASVTIKSKEGFQNPPVAPDVTAEPHEKVAAVDLLAKAYDPDGDKAGLTAKILVAPEGATLAGSTLSVPLRDRAQVVPFSVTDSNGSSTAAVAFIPSMGSGVPELKPGGLIMIDQNKTATFAIADYVRSPRGKPVKIASAALNASPTAGLAAQTVDQDKFSLTARADYVGPGAVVVQVMDATTLTEPGVLTAWVSIPVQIGPKTPVLRCPSTAQTLMQGGEVKNLDITTLCHVWSPDPAELPALKYTATWTKPITDVKAEQGHVVSLQAGNSAPENASGTLSINIANKQAKPSELGITVLPAPLPTMQSQTINDIKQGTPVNVQLGLRSPLLKPEPTIMSVNQVSGPQASQSHQGASLTITPASNVSGTIVFSVTASDVKDPERQKVRQVTRNITMIVYGKPDTPASPQPGNTIQSHATALTWAAPNSNGAPIDSYEVEGSSGTRNTFQSTAANITGLPNGKPVTFRVRAHNKGGWSDFSSASAPVTPDIKPGAPTGVTASNPQDHALTLTWGAPANDGSAIKTIHIAWPGGSRDLPGNPTTTTITGLDNNTKYTFTIWAENDLGTGPNATGTGQSSGKPLGLAVREPVPQAAVGAATPVNIAWAPADPNGPGPVTYTAKRSDGKTICSGAATPSCVDDTVTYNGATYTYSVTATNATGGDHSATATSPVWKATGTPDNWAAWQLAPTAANGMLRVSYTVPAARGASASATILVNGAPAKTFTPNVAGGAGTQDLTGLNNGASYAVSLRVCNDSNRCSTSNQQSAVPFGPLSPPVISASLNGNTANFSASGNGNGAMATLTVRSTRTGQTWSTSGTGALSLSNGQDIGYSASTAYVVSLTTGPTTPGRGNGGEATSNTVTTPNPPPPTPSTVQIKWGAQAVAGQDQWYVLVTTNGDKFSGAYSCQMYVDGKAVSGSAPWGTLKNYSAPVTNDPGFVSGKGGSSSMTIVCAGVTSNALV